MDWGIEVNKFIQHIHDDGVEEGRNQEHRIKSKVCKYFRHQGGVGWDDGCVKTQKNCYREYCPAEKEELKSVRS
jgi:hypothetical protein